MTSKTFRILLLICILLNIFDIVLHVVTDQPEILRITANAIIITASILALLRYRTRLVITIGLVFYLIFNGVFIVLNGIGSAGIAFISLTAAIILLSLFLHKK